MTDLTPRLERIRQHLVDRQTTAGRRELEQVIATLRREERDRAQHPAGPWHSGPDQGGSWVVGTNQGDRVSRPLPPLPESPHGRS